MGIVGNTVGVEDPGEGFEDFGTIALAGSCFFKDTDNEGMVVGFVEDFKNLIVFVFELD